MCESQNPQTNDRVQAETSDCPQCSDCPVAFAAGVRVGAALTLVAIVLLAWLRWTIIC